MRLCVGTHTVTVRAALTLCLLFPAAAKKNMGKLDQFVSVARL